MGARNEPRGRAWARRLLVVTIGAVVVQVLGLVLLDGVAEAVVVFAPYPVLLIGMLLTMPVARPGWPTPPPSVFQTFAPAFPQLLVLVPGSWVGVNADGPGVLVFPLLLILLAAPAFLLGRRRVRRARSGPAPQVGLRRVDGVG